MKVGIFALVGDAPGAGTTTVYTAPEVAQGNPGLRDRPWWEVLRGVVGRA
jgi:hypothetical protein